MTSAHHPQRHEVTQVVKANKWTLGFISVVVTLNLIWQVLEETGWWFFG